MLGAVVANFDTVLNLVGILTFALILGAWIIGRED